MLAGNHAFRRSTTIVSLHICTYSPCVSTSYFECDVSRHPKPILLGFHPGITELRSDPWENALHIPDIAAASLEVELDLRLSSRRPVWKRTCEKYA